MDETSSPKGIYGPNPGEPFPFPFEFNPPPTNIPEPPPYIEATAYVQDEANGRSFDVRVRGNNATKVAVALNEVLATLKGEGR